MSMNINGYLDDIFNVLDAYCHPCVLMGRYALLWMGAAVIQDPSLDLLIRDSQVAAISADIQRTGNWAEVPLVHTCGEDYLQPPPRIYERTDCTFSIKIWTEAAAHILVEDECIHHRPFLIEAPCCEALNPVLLESDLHPGPEISPHRPYLLTTPNTRFLPHIRCQSVSRQPQSKLYIPTISRFLDALISQHGWLKENEPRACAMYGPATDVSLLVRYLFLEMPSQRKKIIPLLSRKSKGQMEEILDRYMRTYKNKLTINFSQRRSENEG